MKKFGLTLMVFAAMLFGYVKYVDLRMPTIKPVVVMAPVKYRGNIRQLMDKIAQTESGRNQYAVNQYGMLGLYQFSPATLHNDLHITETDFEFLNDKHLQDSAMLVYMRDNDRSLRHYVGRVVHGIRLTRSGIIAAAHLAGTVGVLAWIDPRHYHHRTVDANGTTVGMYMNRFAYYKVNFK